MSPEQIHLVQASFARLAGNADGVADAFYTRLFEIDPALRHLFRSDLAGQRRRLMQMLATAVGGLDDVAALLPAVTALGALHAGYGVRDAHYASVGRALIDTLRAGLGEAFTPALEGAWTAVYTVLAGAMQAGAIVHPATA